ncbi:dead-box atp-dependent rna helicase 18-like [Stylonychia lemnae]|uniref:ATP-dependent RNA helicase n=1 Tax=Stylonychia lemnae TaxID=5949 RepID=A0A077ZNM0_STYLE|nr:dead-box atp-dependent rna helicase 18-like [Stylonychia lemnae]|eukprot:CDW71079.1 dead-box atp-dependent rna helicase 18-like [Stylonychia lemnae]
MKKVDFKTNKDSKYQQELDKEEIKAQIETITQYNKVLQKLEINEKVLNCNIYDLFQYYNMAFFGNSLECVILEWSNRMTLCAGLCYYHDKMCTIRLSKQLLKYRSEKELQETLIHEMIHAHLFLTKKGYSRDGTDGHGPVIVKNSKSLQQDFQSKMKEINGITGFKITVYHSFHDEVDSYRKKLHTMGQSKDLEICRLDLLTIGVIQRYFIIQLLGEMHQQKCKGEFIKIAEPEGYKPAKKKDQEVQEKNKFSPDNTLDKFFTKSKKQFDTSHNHVYEEEKQPQNEVANKKKRKRDEFENGNMNDKSINEEQKNNKIRKLNDTNSNSSKNADPILVFDEDDLAMQIALLNQFIVNMEKHYTWDDIPGLDKALVQHIKEKFDFDKVTKVQKAVIPLFQSNKDVCVKACTGSGKTLAFAVPLVQQLMKINSGKNKYQNNEVVGLILAPSRELAIQIYKVVELFQELIGDLQIQYIIGGNKLEYDTQRIREKGCNIVIGTIGRIFDLQSKNLLNFKRLEMLIMDEADKLLEDGNENQLSNILMTLPKQRRTGLFSATMTSQLKSLIRIGMRNPYFVDVRLEDQGIFATPQDIVHIQQFDLTSDKNELNRQIQEINEVPSNLENFYSPVENQALKMKRFIDFLKSIKPSRIIVFFGTCASVDYHNLILQFLIDAKIYKLHGKIDQKKRGKIYQQFRSQDHEEMKCHQVLLTTDLAARGIDIPEVDWIVQYDPPQDSDQYVHRIGRTARAGKSGKSLILLMDNEVAYVEFLAKKQVKIEELKIQEAKNSLSYEQLREKVQNEMKQDRDLIDKASNAFVSFVRYYKEHSLQFIFVMNMLDIGAVANSFYLFKVPRVKEILGKPLKGFNQNNSVSYETVPYKDKNKEKQKEGLLKKRQEKFEFKEHVKEVQAEKDLKKRNVSRQQKVRRKKENDWNEWEELQKEENLIKKLRKGKITLKEFNDLVDDGSDFEDQ